MNHHVHTLVKRLSLRDPQRRALEILDHITEIAPLRKETDLQAALAAIQAEYPGVTDFEREFVSLCFALATGVGKTRLMGAFVAYLHLAHNINNFFVLAPNLTIYNKLIADFMPTSPKYVFSGISEFAVNPPDIVTGDNYEQGIHARKGMMQEYIKKVQINIFNISKINSEVRGGKSLRIKKLSEVLGESYFEYLAGLEDLVLLMDESHRYRASAGVRAINELKPLLGLELTATPFVETGRGGVPFRNVILDYPLSRAMQDGFVKEPAVVTRKNFSTLGMSPEAIEQVKLDDGVGLHESVKVELQTYARDSGRNVVKPFVLIIARDTTHAGQLLQYVQSDAFFKGRYRDKALQVDSSRTGADEDQMLENLLKVERADDPTEIVIHVNMLKEGWDVTNLYTIIPLRAANSRILIEQSIGRGLRLPYGARTNVGSLDRLNIIAHDRFQEIVDEASRPDSVIQLKQVILGQEDFAARTVTVVAQPQLATRLGLQPTRLTAETQVAGIEEPPAFVSPEEQTVAQIAYAAIRRMENQPQKLPGVVALQKPQVLSEVLNEVTAQYRPSQLVIEGIAMPPNISRIVAKTAELVIQQTIDIPHILVVPTGEVRISFYPFTLDVNLFNHLPPSEDLWIQMLRTKQREVLDVGHTETSTARLEDYIVNSLAEFDDVSYDDYAELLYDLAEQTVQRYYAYLSEEDTRKVLRYYRRGIAELIHAQMREHSREETAGYEVVISKGFSALKSCAYTASAADTILDYRVLPTNKSNMAKYLFGGFKRCLYPVQKFQSDSERTMSIILEREAQKWFKPAKGQFQIFYHAGLEHHEYQPDFVAETDTCIYMLEPKSENEMNDPDVLAKQDAAVLWCRRASDHAATYEGKTWKYLLIPHTAIRENMTLPGFAAKFSTSDKL